MAITLFTLRLSPEAKHLRADGAELFPSPMAGEKPASPFVWTALNAAAQMAQSVNGIARTAGQRLDIVEFSFDGGDDLGEALAASGITILRQESCLGEGEVYIIPPEAFTILNQTCRLVAVHV